MEAEINFKVHTPREKFHDDLDSTTTVTSTQRQRSYTEDLEPDGLSNTLNIPQYSDDFQLTSASVGKKSDTLYTTQYSEDFESTSGVRSYGKVTRNPSRYSGELETMKTSFTDTIPEETAVSVDYIEEDTRAATSGRTSRLTYDYDDDTVQPTSGGRTSRLTWQYSDDFDDTERGYGDTEREQTRSYMFPTRSQSSRLYVGSDTDSEISVTVTDQSTWADSSELSEATSEATYLAEHNFVKKALMRLKDGSGQRSRKPTRKPDDVTTSPEDKAALKSRKMFCKKLLNRLKNEQKPPQMSGATRTESTRLRVQGIDSTQYVEHLGISHQAINKLRLENTRARLEKIAKEPVHEPHNCADCLLVLERVARTDFINNKLLVAQEQRITDQLNCLPHLASTLLKEPAVLPGEIQRELSAAHPATVWNRLAQPLLDQNTESGDISSRSLDLKESSPLDTSITCPHALLIKQSCIDNGADKAGDIEEYIQKTQHQVELMKTELYQETNRLLKLDSEHFWKMYFRKIKGS